jgi:nitrogenase molybdenum-iron protein NifN
VRKCLPVLHGSQGCSTYIRRYFINHFREPVDIASSNFSESTAIFGGESNLIQALENVLDQYNPEVIGLATTCLSETIGDNVPLILKEFERRSGAAGRRLPDIIYTSTPSYSGTHMDGFHAAVKSFAQYYARAGETLEKTAVFSNFVSPEDLRFLKRLLKDFGVDGIFLPDYSETFDGETWESYRRIPDGGTSRESLALLGRCRQVLEFGTSLDGHESAARYLERTFGVKRYGLPLPIGVTLTDRFLSAMGEISGREAPRPYVSRRGRLIDSYSDAHKYVFGKKAAVFGEEDFVIGLVNFLFEIGVVPVLCVTGSRTGVLRRAVTGLAESYGKSVVVREGEDFEGMAEDLDLLQPDFLMGNSKGYALSRRMKIPLVRVGFPIHDRIGGQRILHLGYRGTQHIFDRLVNTLIAHEQDQSSVGYAYM